MSPWGGRGGGGGKTFTKNIQFFYIVLNLRKYRNFIENYTFLKKLPKITENLCKNLMIFYCQ